MKNVFLVLLSIVILHSISHATIRRVGYFGPPVAGVDFPNFQEAHDASNPGDTIMMHPGSRFGTATMSIKLVVIGPGYFLSQNANLQANALGMDSTSFGGTLSISNATANGSVFVGCTISANGINITGDNIADITFQRCWLLGNTNSGAYGVTLVSSASNITFQQCAFKGSGVSAQGSATGSNISFINCLFYVNNFGTGIHFSNGLPHSGFLRNCIFNSFSGGSFNFVLDGAWLIQNSIANNANNNFNSAGITFQNCIGTSIQFPAGNGNLQNQPWANIFTLTGSTDAQYTLKAGSPAIGAGIGGTNCGIFGGTAPYKLSGIPSVPTIYAISSPQGNTPTVNTVQINLSTRSNN